MSYSDDLAQSDGCVTQSKDEWLAKSYGVSNQDSGPNVIPDFDSKLYSLTPTCIYGGRPYLMKSRLMSSLDEIREDCENGNIILYSTFKTLIKDENHVQKEMYVARFARVDEPG